MKLSKNFHSYSKVVLFLPRFLLVHTLDYRFKVKKILFRSSILIFIVSVACGFPAILKVHFYCEEIAIAYIEKVFNLVMSLAIYLFSGISYLSFLRNQRNIENIYNDVAKIEYLFFSEKFKIKYCHRRTLIIDSSIYFFTFLFLLVFYINSNKEAETTCYLLALVICQFVPAVLAHMIGKPLILFLYISRQYFGLILEDLTLDRKNISSSRARKIEHLIVLHSSIYNFSKKVNNVYSNYLLGLSMVIFFMILKVLISVIGLIFYASNNFEEFFGICCYALVWIIQFMDIVVTCEKAAEISYSFNLDLHSLFLDDETGLISENEQILNHLQKNNCVQFTAADFFNIDFKLLHNMLASATTYLVLVFQFISLTELPPVNIC
ncbi:Gustatory receptor 172, partial [Halyomorpha halys]